MANILQVVSVSGKTTVPDEVLGNQDVRYLTLGDKNPASGNRYYVSIAGKDADVDWQEGDRIMVELFFCAYKTQGQWHMSNRSDSIQFVEIDNVNCNAYEQKAK